MLNLLLWVGVKKQELYNKSTAVGPILYEGAV